MEPVLLVTGASRGIGAAIARKAAAQGYALAINYQRDQAAAQAVATDIRRAGGKAMCVQADVADRAAVEAMFARVEAELGPLAALVNNAGITGRIGPFMQADPDVIESVIRTNILGTMHCSRCAIDAFRRNVVKGVIVNISSVAASTGSPGEYVHYAASKAAVETLTLGLARELATEGIRVVAVAPGTTFTDIHAAMGEPERPLRVAPKIPMQRLAQPDEIAEPVLWLLSPAASYVTGATLRASGGL